MVFGVGLAVSAIAFVGIRSFFNRPGESALTFVPSNALGVVVCDFQPGPGQLGAFRKLFSASDGADMQKSFDSMSQMMGDSAWMKEAIPHLRHSGILALVPGSRSSGGSAMDQADPIFILPVSDAGGLDTLLRKHLLFDAAHGSYSMQGQEFKAAIIGDDLVLGRSEGDLDAVRVCRSDPSRSFASLDQYRVARKSIDADSNLMLFITDSGFRTFGKTVGRPPGFPADGWFAAGLAVRDEGLSMSCTVPISANGWAPYKELAAMPPVRRDLFDLSSASRDQRRLLSGKTIAYAIVGHAVVVASSLDLLGRGIRAYQGHGQVLSSDTRFASFSPIAGDSPQFFSEVDVSRTAAAAGSAVPWDSVPKAGVGPALGAIKALGAFRRPGTMSIHAGETSVLVHMFIPMDYDSIGQFVKEQEKTLGPGAPDPRITQPTNL